jgi:RNA polymerase sigma-70 factor (ECF subfamily)
MLSRTRPAIVPEDAAPVPRVPRLDHAAPLAAPAVLGNDHELDHLFKEHFPFVWRLLRRLGVRPEALDDATQDVFMVALRRAPEFRGQSSYQTWLFGIACNVAREQRRKGQRASAFEPVEPLENALRSGQASPLEQASQAQALRFVESFLDTLDDAKREVFILAELEQMTAPEIVQATGANLNTVYSRLRAAREAFASLIQRTFPGEP